MSAALAERRQGERRPQRVIVADYDRSPNATTLVLRIPDDSTSHQKVAACLLSDELNRRLQNRRWTVEYALGSFTLTGPWLQGKFAEHGIQITERTAYNYVRNLVNSGALERVGQLLGQFHLRGDELNYGRGANLYSLAQLAEAVVNLGRDLYGRLNKSTGAKPLAPFPDPSLFTENRRRRRVDGALDWAIRTASPGCRSTTGWRLAAILKTIGVAEHEAQEVVAEYHGHVGDWKYTARDAAGDVRRCYANRGARGGRGFESPRSPFVMSHF